MSQTIPVDENVRSGINRRVGHLLSRERTNVGLDVWAVANRLQIAPFQLRRWERGLASPPANVFYRLVEFYGREAMHRAAELDLQLQIEKYHRHLASTTAGTALNGSQTVSLSFNSL